jgi:hypothetical protein
MKRVFLTLACMPYMVLFSQTVEVDSNSIDSLVSHADTSSYTYEHAGFIKQQLSVVETWSDDKKKWFYDNFTYPNNITIPKEKIRPYQPKD